MVDSRLLSSMLFHGQHVRRRERSNYWRYRFFTDDRATNRHAQPVEKTKQRELAMRVRFEVAVWMTK